MFTTIKRKLATLVRRKKRPPPPRVKDQAHTDYRMSSSRSSDRGFGLVHYSPRPWIAANRPYRAIGFREEDDQISTLDLSGESHHSRSIRLSAANSTPSENPQQQPESDPKSHSSATSETEIAGPIVVRFQGKYHQALLLTIEMFEGIRSIARTKRELDELDLEITKLSGQANELRLAMETLERRAKNAVPGAFPNSTADGGENARRQLLMPAMRRRLEICERSLHDLSGRRHLLGAELDAARQKIIEALELI